MRIFLLYAVLAVSLINAQEGLCTAQDVTLDSVSREICENTESVCEVYIKKGTLNGESVVTGNDYCEALGMVCLAQFDDGNSCAKGTEYSDCTATGGGTSDHIVRCGPAADCTAPSIYRYEVPQASANTAHLCVRTMKFYYEGTQIDTPTTDCGAPPCTQVSTIYADWIGSKAFNNNEGDAWCAEGGYGYGWIEYDFGVPTKVDRVSMVFWDGAHSALGEAYIEQSSDGFEYANIVTITDTGYANLDSDLPEVCSACDWAEVLPFSAGQTCSTPERVYHGGVSIENCKEEAIALNAPYMFYGNSYCHVYETCENSRTPEAPGITYYYDYSCGGTVVPDVDCVGAFGSCGTDCLKSFAITIEQSGSGAACANADGETVDCAHGEDACPVDCTVNTLTATPVDCFCGTSDTACSVGQFCRDDSCHVDASHVDCEVSAYDPVTHECGCMASDICAVGEFCFDGACTHSAHCHRPDDVHQSVFYGAKIMGLWDAPTRSMHMKIPIPGYFTLDEITWINAQDPTILAYHDGEMGLWNVDMTDECEPVYELNVPQTTFFGQGSRFSVTGKRMQAGIEVDVRTDITRVHHGHTYTRERHVTNSLPVMVNLVTTTVISATFYTGYEPTGPPSPGACKSVVLLVACEDVNFTTMKLECQATYGDSAGLMCDSIECSEGSMTQVNFEENLGPDEPMGSQQDEIDALITSIVASGWSTASYTGATEKGPCETLEPVEFVIFLEARENVLVSGTPSISIVMETHSRGCIDHSSVNGGIQVDSDSAVWIDDSVPETFTWTMDDATGDVANQFEWNLCVETVEWTFTPSITTDGEYDVVLVFDQKTTYPSFYTTASINIAKSDVLGDIEFDTVIELYDELGAGNVPVEPAQTVFQIGERMYAKVELENLVVDAETIDCTEFTVTQYPGDDFIDEAISDLEDLIHDMLNVDVYKFDHHPTPSLKNTAVFGADLDLDTFLLSIEGVQSVLDVGLSITYVQGEQENIRLRRLLGGSNWMETAVGEDDGLDYSKMEREPEQKHLSAGFEITVHDEYMVAMVMRKITSNPQYTGLFLFGIAAAGLAFNAMRTKSSAHAYLLADEEF